jgi:adenine-specific DNA-methyltransferase
LKVRDEVNSEKLRGGFYTPPGLVAEVLAAAKIALGGEHPSLVLEPSAGDGAFIRSIANEFPRARIIGVEIDPEEAAKAEAELRATASQGEIVNESTLKWALTSEPVDLVIGNLPFVRFQFISESDRQLSAIHAQSNGVAVGGVANLWWPMLLASLSNLRQGGVFSLILPSECFTGVSAGAAREWLLRSASRLRIDLFSAKSFPGALQEVVVVSGVWGRAQSISDSVPVVIADRDPSSRNVHASRGGSTRHVKVGPENWIRILMSEDEGRTYDTVRALPSVQELAAFVKFEVAAVTGANAFFSLTEQQVAERGLEEWVVPLLSRMKFAPGLVYTSADHEQSALAGAATHLFSVKRSLDGERFVKIGLDEYLRAGEEAGLHLRFKTRSRSPWYAIPSVRREDLFMSKRSHYYPRVAVNDTLAVTTDTIYRGRVVDSSISAIDVAASFHNSITLLSAEIEGRSFGGGVLELVPSEVSRLAMPNPQGSSRGKDNLDFLARSASRSESGSLALVEATNDLLIARNTEITKEMLDSLESGRQRLVQRRLGRN